MTTRSQMKKQKRHLANATAAALSLVRPRRTSKARADRGSTKKEHILLAMKIMQLQRSKHGSSQENEL